MLYYTSAIIVSIIVSFVIGVICTIFAPGPDKSLSRVFVWTAVFCLWFVWFIVYASQVNIFLIPIKKAHE
jgi:hypothetical protein